MLNQNLTVKNLTKSYSDATILENLDFEVKQGSFVTILGPSGCGKSTFLRSIAGLENIDSGSIHIGERELTNLNPQERNIGMVFQQYALFPNMTVKQNIMFGLKFHNLTKQEKEERVLEIIEDVKLSKHIDKYPANLSGGQKQRVALARSLIIRPDILLLDEPLSSLDEKMRKSLRKLLLKFNSKYNLTMICVSHDQEEALSMSKQVFIMNDGKFVQKGNPEEIYTRPNSEFVANFIGNYNFMNLEDHKDLKNVLEINAKKIAIRPESIYIDDESRNFSEQFSNPVKVKIKDSMLLGGIIRYTVTLGEPSFELDTLNRSSDRLFHKGDFLDIRFDKNEIVELK